MMWIVLALAIVVVIGVGTLIRRYWPGARTTGPAAGATGPAARSAESVGRFARSTGRLAGSPGSFAGPGAQRRCRACMGTGWIGGEPERTFNFVGDGFEDTHAPATICPTCGGSGSVPTP